MPAADFTSVFPPLQTAPRRGSIVKQRRLSQVNGRPRSNSRATPVVPNYVPEILYLPRTMDNWPWERKINPHMAEVSLEANKWLWSLQPFAPKLLKAFEKCDFGRLASLGYCSASREHLRTGIDLINLCFVLDDTVDLELQPVVREIIDVVLDSLHNPDAPRPAGEISLGQITKEFWLRARANSTPESQKFFLAGFTDYLEALVVEAGDRSSSYIRTVEEYISVRRSSIGVRACLFPGCMDLSMPDELWYHPLIMELENCISDLVLIDNDLASFNKEQAQRAAEQNLVTVVMHNHKLDYSSAVEWIAAFHAEVQRKFLSTINSLPALADEGVREQLDKYIQVLGNFPRANESWNFESWRYFGDKGMHVQKSRLVPRMPQIEVQPSA